MIMMKSLFKKENHGRHFRYLFCSSENNDFILRDIFIWTVCAQFLRWNAFLWGTRCHRSAHESQWQLLAPRLKREGQPLGEAPLSPLGDCASFSLPGAL